MSATTIAIRVLDELRRSGLPLDDDELARRLDVSPRQSINQACRRLAHAGRVRRYVGPDGKIVNDVRGADPSPSVVDDHDVVAAPNDGVLVAETAAGDSREQRQAERVMLELLGRRFGLALAPRRISMDGGVRVEVDGADADLSVLVEAWAHQGRPKVAQKHKVLADALKLLHIASTLPVAPRLVLCLCDRQAAHHFTTARSWAAQALRDFGVQVEVVELPADLQAAVLAAQQRQFR